jgi:hypothetical protein
MGNAITKPLVQVSRLNSFAASGALDRFLLQQKPAGFSIEPQEEDRIRLHLSLQEQRGQGAALLDRQ